MFYLQLGSLDLRIENKDKFRIVYHGMEYHLHSSLRHQERSERGKGGKVDMDVSENSGTPKSSHLNRVFHDFHHPFWGVSPGFPPNIVEIQLGGQMFPQGGGPTKTYSYV